MLRKVLYLFVIWARGVKGTVGASTLRMRQVSTFVRLAVVAWGLVLGGNLLAATVPPGFTETTISGPWTNAVGVAFETNGRMYVWEGTGQVWFKDPGDANYTLLLDIHDEVGKWGDHGMLGFRAGSRFSSQRLHLCVVCRGSVLSFPFRRSRLRSQCKRIQRSDDRAADPVHVPIRRWLSVSGPGQSADFDWGNQTDGNPNLLHNSWSGELGLR